MTGSCRSKAKFRCTLRWPKRKRKRIKFRIKRFGTILQAQYCRATGNPKEKCKRILGSKFRASENAIHDEQADYLLT